MRNLLLVFIFAFIFAPGSFLAQTTTPLTQAEFVKSLYELQRNPVRRDALVEQIRVRGIGFEMTEPLRSLVQSKSGDAVLIRTLDEAVRRRSNPSRATLLSEKDASELLTKAREATLTASDEMPDFVVKQQISRFIGYAGTNNWRFLDKLTVGVSYSADKGEIYKVLAIDGNPINAAEGSNYGGLSGATTGGEFIESLAFILNKARKAEFKQIDTDVLRGRRAVVYEYKIPLEDNQGKFNGIGYGNGSTRLYTPAGQKGKIWIDRENSRVLRLEQQYIDIPSTFPVKAFESFIDYDWVEIGGQKYLLPILSESIFTAQRESDLIQARNQIRFRNYNRFGTEIKILDDDEPVEEPAKGEKKP